LSNGEDFRCKESCAENNEALLEAIAKPGMPLNASEVLQPLLIIEPDQGRY
jgi:hypothetical protein